MIEICAVGGYCEVGRNMTAVRVNDSVFIFDMGLMLPNFIKLNDTLEEYAKVSESSLKRAGAVPEDKIIKDWKNDVAAIVIGHAHLDHLGAVPYLAQKYDCPIVCTPFTAAVLKNTLSDEKIYLDNDIIELKGGKSLSFRGGIRLELVHTTHSTPQTVLCALHTKEGVVLYANDYRLDDHPTLGKPPDYVRIKELKKKGIKALVQDCLYAETNAHNPSETLIKEKLEKALHSCRKDKAIVVTTFSSHIERLKTIAEVGRKLNRKVVFAGRSLSKYAYAAKDANVTNLDKYAKILKYSRQTRAVLKDVKRKGKDKFLLVVSGHQGEPKSTLVKMINGVYDWKWEPGDAVVFSSKVIPVEPNISNRKAVDDDLKKMGVKIYDNIHTSGHCFLKDLERVLDITKPEHVFPTHAEKETVDVFCKMAKRKGFRNVHVLAVGDRYQL